MNREDTIDVGDTVLVETSKGSFVFGVVLYTPAATGDSWRVRSAIVPEPSGYIDTYDGSLIYIQQFITMKKLPAQPSSSEPDTQARS